jgi:hypothetical protein
MPKLYPIQVNIQFTNVRDPTGSESTILYKKGGIFYCSTLFNKPFHLPPLRFHCVGGCWDRTQLSCDFGIGCQTPLTSRPDLIHDTVRKENPCTLARRHDLKQLFCRVPTWWGRGGWGPP